MGWIRQVAPEGRHDCNLPRERYFRSKHFAVGSIWQCDTCLSYWEYVPGAEGPYWEVCTQQEALPTGPTPPGGVSQPRNFVKSGKR
jgi:hypothetical protein